MRLQTLSIFACILFNIFQFQQVFSQYTHPETDEEFVGPFPSWVDVRKDFGAVGDGVHDDTDAIQLALNAIGNKTSTASVIFFPSGTYRITRTLKFANKMRVGVVGEHPSNTIIKWDGPSGGTMLWINGVALSRINRLTWDGSGTALVAVEQSWEGIDPYFDSSIEYGDDVFVDVSYGIRGGFRYSISFAETAILRCKFIRNSIVGVCLGNHNALDIWIWNSIFEDCRVGVSNDIDHGAGGFKVYNSVFRRSTFADITIGNTIEFSFRNNTSINSKTFLVTGWTPNPAPIVIQGNTIIDPIDDIAISIKNQGAITLIDNVIRSRSGVVAPVILIAGPPDSDLLALGNTFTVTNPIQASRNIIFDVHVVSPSSLAGLKEPKLPGVQPNHNRKIFEVPNHAGSGLIQKIINDASLLKGERAVVHFPIGQFNIDTTIIIPEKSDIQIIGDSYWTVLTWKSLRRDAVIHVMGPSKATIQDITINGNNIATGILATNVDQVASRIYTNQSQSNNNQVNYFVNGLDNAMVLLTNAGGTFAKNTSIKVVGGPKALAGNPTAGRTVIYAGVSFDNRLNIEVSNGGNLLVRDVWYESKYINQFLSLPNTGSFIIEGSHIANTNTSKQNAQLQLNNFSGKALFLNSFMDDRISLTGDCSRSTIFGIGLNSYRPDPFADSSTQPILKINTFLSRARQNSPVGVGSYAIPNKGLIDKNSLLTIMEPVRNVTAQVLSPISASATDLRLNRVWIEYAINGLDLQGSAIDSLAVLEKKSGVLIGSARPEHNLLEWATNDTATFVKYEIERSDENLNFLKIGLMPGSIGLSDKKKMLWIDTNAKIGSNFYRIKSLKSTGTVTYSNVINLRRGEQSSGLQVYPNPMINTSFTMKVNDLAKGNYHITMVDAVGHTIHTRKLSHQGGFYRENVTIPQVIPKGNYTIQLICEGRNSLNAQILHL